jgi:hypothetical protein
LSTIDILQLCVDAWPWGVSRGQQKTALSPTLRESRMLNFVSRYRRSIAIALAASTSLACASHEAEAKIARLEVVNTIPAFDGRTFGEVGAYELLIARAYGELDPTEPRNAAIADINLAPKNERGQVEYSTEVQILKPVDPSRGNHRLFYEVLNRGNKLSVRDFNDAPSGNDMSARDTAGNGFLFERGYTLVWAGWQNGKNIGEGNGRMRATIPEARNVNGESITGQVIMSAIFNNTKSDKIELLFAPADPRAEDNKVLVHNRSTDAPVPLPRDAWSFVDEKNVQIKRDHPFLAEYDAGAQYDVIYTAKDPDVSGIGFAITRDVASFLRNEASDANPLRGQIRYALAQGTSQSGRMLKGFIHGGFNEDEAGRAVFDGINPNVSGSHSIALNERFGDANATGRAYERHANAKIEFPFTYEVRTDPLTGKSDGIFARCIQSNTCPKVIHTDGGNEGWGKAASLVTTDGMGGAIPLPDNVRVYYFASTQHDPAQKIEQRYCQQQTNPNRWQPILRALWAGLDGWATAGIEPPASAYPRSGDGSLSAALPQKLVGFPEIPGVTYNGTFNKIGVPDTSGLPFTYVKDKYYDVQVPRTDADGNDLGGIRTVDVAVPRGTYTGWALRRAGFAENEECQLNGQYIPFAATREERLAKGDPRPSIEERYPSPGAYIRKVSAAAEELVGNGYLLPSDAEAAIEAAAKRAMNGMKD